MYCLYIIPDDLHVSAGDQLGFLCREAKFFFQLPDRRGIVVLAGRDMPCAGDIIATGEGFGHRALLQQYLNAAIALADQPEMRCPVGKAFPVSHGPLYGFPGRLSVFIHHIKIFFQVSVPFPVSSCCRAGISSRSFTTYVSCPVALMGLEGSRNRMLPIPALLAASTSRLRSPT